MRSYLLVAALILGGCGFTPTEGTWLMDQGTVLEDSCDLHEDSTEDETFELIDNGDGTFDADGEFHFECELDGKDFTCPRSLTDEEDIDSADAKLEGYREVVGTFDDIDQMSGTHDAEVRCVGDDCDSIATALDITFPCTVVQEFTASLQE